MVNIIYYFVVKEKNVLETRKDSSKRKKRIDIACFIWYTSTGRAIPKIIKYKDEKGTLRVMTNIQVIFVEEKIIVESLRRNLNVKERKQIR